MMLLLTSYLVIREVHRLGAVHLLQPTEVAQLGLHHTRGLGPGVLLVLLVLVLKTNCHSQHSSTNMKASIIGWDILWPFPNLALYSPEHPPYKGTCCTRPQSSDLQASYPLSQLEKSQSVKKIWFFGLAQDLEIISKNQLFAFFLEFSFSNRGNKHLSFVLLLKSWFLDPCLQSLVWQLIVSLTC